MIEGNSAKGLLMRVEIVDDQRRNLAANDFEAGREVFRKSEKPRRR